VIIFDTERHFNMLNNTIKMVVFVVCLLSSAVSIANDAEPSKTSESVKVSVYLDVDNTSQNKKIDNNDDKIQVMEVSESDQVSSQTVATLLLVALVGFVGLSNRSTV